MLLPLAVLVGCNPFDSKLVGFCEDILKERLRSPSGYNRVEVSEYQEEVSISEWLEEENRTSADSRDFNTRMAAMMEEAGDTPTRFTVYIRYDAPNAYGTLVRGLAGCEYLSDNADPPTAEYGVRVDGMTHTEWLISQLKK